MSIQIKVPAMGESVTEATVARWFKKEGDAVARDEPLLELETDKVTVEVPAPADGAIESIGRKEIGILTYLQNNQAVVITRKALIHSVWGLHADVRSRSLDQYVVKVRELCKKHTVDLSAFRTVHGVGYIFDPQGVSQEGK